MRRARRLAVLLALVTLAACTSHPGPGPSPGPSVPGEGPSGIRGSLVYIGGPAGGGAPPLRPGTVRVYDLGGVLRSRATFPEGRGFRLVLPPGTYRIIGESGDANCHALTATVHSHTFLGLQLRCDVK